MEALRTNLAVLFGVILLLAAACAGQLKSGPGAEVPAVPTTGIDWIWSEPASLYFAKTETTVAQYRLCAKAGACDPEHSRNPFDERTACTSGLPSNGYPINCVSVFGAKEFCRWVGGRLPTSDEWEAEALNGGERMYPWGDEGTDCTRAIMDDGGEGCGEERPWPVCSKLTGNSVSGLCDMEGNVNEWTSSLADPESDWYSSCGARWSRGGGSLPGKPCSYRFSPIARIDSIGFRCVRESP